MKNRSGTLSILVKPRTLILLSIFLGASVILLSFLIFNQTNVGSPYCEKCNIILINLDTLGNHLPCYGYDKNTAPYLCDFAQKNIYFTNSYSQGYWTLPSLFSIFTGLLPSKHEMWRFFEKPLSSKNELLAEILKKNFYDTIYIGPSDDGAIPFDRGLNRGFTNFISSDGRQFDLKEGMKRFKKNTQNNVPTFLFYQSYDLHDPYLLDENEKLLFTKDYLPDVPTSKKEYYKIDKDFLQYVNEIITIWEKDSMNYKNLVAPNIKNLERLKKAETPEEINLIISQLSGLTQFVLFHDRYSRYFYYNDKKTVDYMKALYDQNIHKLDEKLKIYIEELKSISPKNTIIAITSVHGEAFGEHGAFFHDYQYLYNELNKVPLIMSIPGIRQKKIEEIVQNIDLLPTLCGLVGVPCPHSVQGKDVTDVILSTPFAKTHDYIIVESSEERKAVISKEWKLYVKNMERIYKPESIELYNLIKDPQEQHNVALFYPDIVMKHMAKLLENMWQDIEINKL